MDLPNSSKERERLRGRLGVGRGGRAVQVLRGPPLCFSWDSLDMAALPVRICASDHFGRGDRQPDFLVRPQADAAALDRKLPPYPRPVRLDQRPRTACLDLGRDPKPDRAAAEVLARYLEANFQ